jgi:hypothetical protein
MGERRYKPKQGDIWRILISIKFGAMELGVME